MICWSLLFSYIWWFQHNITRCKLLSISVGHTLLAVNGIAATGKQLEDGRDIMDVVAKEENYPIAIKFGRPKLTTNEKIMLAGMFHSYVAF